MQTDVTPYHLDEGNRENIQTAIDKAAHKLIQYQGTDGALHSETEGGVPTLPLTAMTLWALSEADGAQKYSQVCSAAAAYLLSFQQEDGGIYDPSQGLVRYTAAVARQGLQAWASHQQDLTLSDALDRLNLFVYRNRELESLADEQVRSAPGQVTADVEKLLQREDLPQDIRKALQFLMDARRKPTDEAPYRHLNAVTPPSPETPVAIAYDDLLRYIGEISRRDNPTLWRAYNALRAYYTLDGNPDLTKRYGPNGFQDETAGLFYYYLTVARTLGTVGRPEFTTLDGKRHDWAKELSRRLLALQGEDGLWVNENGRWLEGDPLLVTCYAIISLNICRDLKGPTK